MSTFLHTRISGRLTKLANLEFYTEGPALDISGNLYFTMLGGGKVMKFDIDGVLSEWTETACPNGQIIASNGDHLVCDSKLGKVRRFSSEGKYIKDESGETCAGAKVQVPNDLVLDAEGNLYFTDSVRYTGAVFCIGVDGKEEQILSELDYANGIILSNDGNTLYVAESYKNRIIQVDLVNRVKGDNKYQVFVNLPVHPSGEAIHNLPDGIAINSNGIMAVAHYGMQAVQLIDSSGKFIATVDSGMPCTSNVYFVDDRTLIVTGGYGEPGPGAVYIMDLNNVI